MLIDEVEITIKAGHGGPGMSSFGGHGPDGGNGGKGGDVYISVTSDLRALNQFSAEKNIRYRHPNIARSVGSSAGLPSGMNGISTVATVTFAANTWSRFTGRAQALFRFIASNAGGATSGMLLNTESVTIPRIISWINGWGMGFKVGCLNEIT